MSMRNYIIRRLLLMIPLFLGITVINFVIIQFSPIDAVDIATQGQQITPVARMEMKVEYGLYERTVLQTSNGKGYWGTIAGDIASLTTPATIGNSAYIQGSLTNTSWEDASTPGEEKSTSADGEYVFAWFKFALQDFDVYNWLQNTPEIRANVTALGSGNEVASGWRVYFSYNTSNILNWHRQTTEQLSSDLNEMRFRQPFTGFDIRDFIIKENGVNTFSVLVVSRASQLNSVPINLRIDKFLLTCKIFFPVPIWIQYFNWLGKLLVGQDYSYVESKPVRNVILTYAYETVKLQLASLILSLLIAIPIGVVSATKQYSLIDNTAMTAALLGISLPVFWTGLMCLLLFSYYMPLFPFGGAYPLTFQGDPSTNLLDAIYYYLILGGWHMVLPTIILGTAGAALVTRLVRSSMLEVLRQDYIMTARSKGLRERLVIYKHALRNSLIPVVTVIGVSVGFLLAGAALTETVFNWPGLGRIAVQAALRRDYYLVLGINITVGIMVMFANLVTDISYAFLDPRIRY
ncbi:MAG: ABC transporter permease [Candidatus Hermodarchaeota archaeon]